MKTVPRQGHKRRGAGLQLKMALSYLLVIAMVLLLLNFYPVMVSQDFVFQSKENALSAKVSMMTASLSMLEILSEENVARALALLDSAELSRVVITDAAGRVVYDNSVVSPALGRLALQPEITAALRGSDVFRCRYQDNAFQSQAASPILSRGVITGAVYLYEYDSDQAALLRGIQRNIATISLAVCLVVVALGLFFSTWFSRRVGGLVSAMREIHAGKLEQRVPVRGRDELAEMAVQFNDMADQLEHTEQMRRQFISDASHELKTPMTAIGLLTDSILQTKDMDPETMREFIGDVNAEVDRLTRLTEKLLMLTRSDAEVAAWSQRVDLTEVTLRAAHMVDPLATHEGVDIRCELGGDCFIYANEDDVYQAVFNLMENAIKYNQVGGSVSAFLYQQNRQVMLIIEDTGMGIPEEDLPHVFDRFYRVDKARSREKGGSGLGLSIVKANIQRYGGTIGVESTLGKGTRFTVSFPLYLN